MDISSKYIEFLVRIALQLEEGEVLTINAEKSMSDFAAELAQVAADVSLHTTNVVVLENGKVDTVIPVAPIINELKSNPKRFLLLRIDDTETRIFKNDESIEEIVKEFSLLQKSGNLASPQLNRPVAPWAVIPFANSQWAKRIYNDETKVDKLWQDFENILSLNQDKWQLWWINNLSKREEVMFQLNNLIDFTYHIKGEDFSFSAKAASKALWSNHQFKLDNGRSYIPYLPNERYSILLDATSSEGYIRIKESFSIFNTKITDAYLEFKNGKVTNFDASSGLDALKLALTYDEGSSIISELSLVDKRVPLAKYDKEFGYCGFDANRRSSIVIGCGEINHLKSIESYTDEKELQKLTGCNISTIQFRLPLDLNIDVSAIDSDGFEVPIMYDGDIIT